MEGEEQKFHTSMCPTIHAVEREEGIEGFLLLDWNFIMIVFDAEAWLGRFGQGFAVQRSTMMI